METKVICSHYSCERPKIAKGLCPLHYERKRKNSDLDAPIGRWHYLEGVTTCQVSWCNEPRKFVSSSKGFRSICAKHVHIQQVWKEIEPIIECDSCHNEYMIKPAIKGRNRFPLCDECYSYKKFAPSWTTLVRHNITLGYWINLYIKQDGKCGRCKQQNKKLQVDHDHSCCPYVFGKGNYNQRTCGNCIRGLLCGPCNLLVGKFETNKLSIEAYLNEYRTAENKK